MQQLDHRRFFGTHRIGQRAEVDVALTQLFRDRARQPADLVGAAIDTVDSLQQLAFGDHRQVDVALEDARKFVEGEQVSGVGHPDQDGAVAVFQRQRTETARLIFRQTAHDLQIGIVVLEVDVGDVELPGQRLGDLVFGDETVVHQHAPQFAAAALLLFQHEL